MILVSLVGEQPAPNLLPARRLRPKMAVLVYTSRTQSTAEKLKGLLARQCGSLLCKVDPYDLPRIHNELAQFLDRETPGEPLVFNLTGGTKPMVLAAYRLAEERGCAFLYFQTEGNRSCLFRYTFGDSSVNLDGVEELPETISLDDYLRLHLGAYEASSPRDPLEEQVFLELEATPGLEVLTSVRPQRLGALEVDFAVRFGNQVGIGEVKSKAAKKAIDQLNAVADPRYLGTYVRKFLVSARTVDRNNLDLAKAYRIQLIQLPSYAETGALDAEDRKKLRQCIVQRLGGGA